LGNSFQKFDLSFFYFLSLSRFICIWTAEISVVMLTLFVFVSVLLACHVRHK